MNSVLSIYFSQDSELIELEILDKEYREDILIKINENFYQLEFITLSRFLRECEILEECNCINIINKMTIFSSPNKDNIINTIIKLYEMNFFKNCSPINLQIEYASNFTKLQNLDNWIKIYDYKKGNTL